jgi:hypothetical protein
MAVAIVTPDTASGIDELVVVPFPSCPLEFSPQHWTPPPESNAQAKSAPAATADAPVIPDTITGVVELVVVPLPSCPLELSPQHWTLPPERSAQAKFAPTVTATADVHCPSPQAPEQVFPQLPQLFGSVCPSTQAPPQTMPPAGHAQAPPTQIPPVRHWTPHDPQLFGSVEESTH